MRIAALLAAASLAAAPAAAQDIEADVTYAELELRSGFANDPRMISLRSGGDIDASSIGAPCTGFIAEAPDVRLVYSAGELPLILSVASRADTTLVVNAPDGRWYCDDDSGEAPLNPMVRFNNPASGRYEIWVGTFRDATVQPADLHISEMRSR